MFRFAASTVLGFVLLYVQSLIVMKLNGYTSIHFSNLYDLAVVWVIDFFIVFGILTQLKPWLIRSKIIETSSAEDYTD